MKMMHFPRLLCHSHGPRGIYTRFLSNYPGGKLDFILDRLGRPEWAKQNALIDAHHNLHLTYEELDQRSSAIAQSLSTVSCGRPVGAFTKPNVDFCVNLLAAWKARKCFVPLSNTHSISEVRYFVEDSNLSTILCASKEDIPQDFRGLPVHYLETNNIKPTTAPRQLHALDSMSSDALIVYTSGTTGRPKGVVHSHDSLHHMFASLTDAWQYTEKDRILHFLPLYHMHGLVNKLLTVLYNGGTVQFLPYASPSTIWTALASECLPSRSIPLQPLSLFMAVPTVYAKLLEHWPLLPLDTSEQALRTIQQLRLQVSGSAALPDSLLRRWRDLTKATLLERYGMTEIGMALGNPLNGPRKAGSVGLPMKHVQVRLVDEAGCVSAEDGELQVKGPCVFKEYLNNPTATSQTFDDGGWFKTGDIACRDDDGYYRIKGRASTDIIKTAGYKVSALEIERELLSCEGVDEVAVVGQADEIKGEKIVAVVKTATKKLDESVLDKWLEDKLAHYKRPKEYVFVKEIPRNALGKVNKKTLLKELKRA